MNKQILNLGALIVASLFFANCSNNDDSTYVDPNANLFTEVLNNVPTNVITDTYKQLNEKAMALKNAINTLAITPDEANLAAVKAAWQATRSPWEQSESFLYGPVGIEEVVDPAIDSWPVDVAAINTIISNSAPITAASLETNDDARGFHTIEYFVWGINGNKAATALTARELEFLKAAADDLQRNTQKLYDAWKTSGSNAGSFANQFINAGQSGSQYVSQKAALAEIVEGLFGIADEVASGKIETPLNGNAGAAKPEAEESRFSNNSKLDFANNIRSIQNVYTGDFDDTSGKGISDIVILTNPTLDAIIKAKITAAIEAIEAIPGTFTQAISNNRAQVQNAQQKVDELKIALESQLFPFINNL
ncbi:imelysin family protein [Flavobacterium kingsejongi]|uniref:Imelysin n=1 Tax=Flavobacterium kingsejongi TaxID=1678728 RepID=A0A2S1LRI1_9FLAO|nr:imelysin family protein [Flavobacterium kingsejongi]AWG26363.1 imelysin [Flavobacterium kingsejongi]